MKNIMNRVPDTFEELLSSISSMVSFCKSAKIFEKTDFKCKVLFNLKNRCDNNNDIPMNEIKSIAIRNDFSTTKGSVRIFIEDCIGYAQVLTLNIKQTFFLFVALLEE